MIVPKNVVLYFDKMCENCVCAELEIIELSADAERHNVIQCKHKDACEHAYKIGRSDAALNTQKKQ